MKKLTNIISIIMSLSIILSLVSCSEPNNTNNTAIILSDKNVELSEIGETYTVTATVRSDSSEPPVVVWSSSDESVATCVDGVITAVGYGVCVIRASCSSISSACTVNIPNPNPKLTLSETVLSFDSLGAAKTVTAISETGADISPKVIWKSSNEKIATCSNGVIKSIGYGVCTVTAFLNNESRSCIVEILDPDTPSVSINLTPTGAENTDREYKKLKLSENEELLLTATASPGDSAVKWISSDESVATCDDGKITAKKSGVCVIIAISDKGATDYVHLTVGSYTDPKPDENKLLFGFPDVGKALKYIDKDTGQISSISVITSYTIVAEPYERFNDRMLITLQLHCVKVYDIAGEGGVTPSHITTDMYREDDIYCEQHTFKEVARSVGDTFTVKYEPQFTIQESAEGPRVFYMTFAEFTEL